MYCTLGDHMNSYITMETQLDESRNRNKEINRENKSLKKKVNDYESEITNLKATISNLKSKQYSSNAMTISSSSYSTNNNTLQRRSTSPSVLCTLPNLTKTHGVHTNGHNSDPSSNIYWPQHGYTGSSSSSSNGIVSYNNPFMPTYDNSPPTNLTGDQNIPPASATTATATSSSSSSHPNTDTTRKRKSPPSLDGDIYWNPSKSSMKAAFSDSTSDDRYGHTNGSCSSGSAGSREGTLQTGYSTYVGQKIAKHFGKRTLDIY